MKITLAASAAVAALTVGAANAQSIDDLIPITAPAGTLSSAFYYAEVEAPMRAAGFGVPAAIPATCTHFNGALDAGSPFAPTMQFLMNATNPVPYMPAFGDANYLYLLASGASELTPNLAPCGNAYDTALLEFTDCAIRNISAIVAENATAGLPDPFEALGASFGQIDPTNTAALLNVLSPWFTTGKDAFENLASLLVEGDFVEAAVRKAFCNGFLGDSSWAEIIGTIKGFYPQIRTLATNLPEVFPWSEVAPTTECRPQFDPSGDMVVQPLLTLLDAEAPAFPPSINGVPINNIADIWYGICVVQTPPPTAPTTSAPTGSPTTSAPTTSPTTSAPTTSPTTGVPTMSPVTSVPTGSPTYYLPYPFDLQILMFGAQYKGEIENIVAALLVEELQLADILAGFGFPYGAESCGLLAAPSQLGIEGCVAKIPTAVPAALDMVTDLIYGSTGLDAQCNAFLPSLGDLANIYQGRVLADQYLENRGIDAQTIAGIQATVDVGLSIITDLDVAGLYGLIEDTLESAAVTCTTPITDAPTPPPTTEAPSASSSNMVTVSVAAALAAVALM